MIKNVGSLDKTLRLIAGITILVVGYLNNSWWGLIGLIPIITSITNFCPIYIPLKMSTIKSKK
jgi:Inner membrane protein YgaP-like, transmembrane domain